MVKEIHELDHKVYYFSIFPIHSNAPGPIRETGGNCNTLNSSNQEEVRLSACGKGAQSFHLSIIFLLILWYENKCLDEQCFSAAV